MGPIWSLLAVVTVFGAVMAGLAWLGGRVRRRGGRASGAVVGPFEELWHPAAHRARFEIETVEERTVSPATPDDPFPRHRDTGGGQAIDLPST